MLPTLTKSQIKSSTVVRNALPRPAPKGTRSALRSLVSVSLFRIARMLTCGRRVGHFAIQRGTRLGLPQQASLLNLRAYATTRMQVVRFRHKCTAWRGFRSFGHVCNLLSTVCVHSAAATAMLSSVHSTTVAGCSVRSCPLASRLCVAKCWHAVTAVDKNSHAD